MEHRSDAHIHLFTSRDLEEYEALRRRHAIERALVVGYEGSPRFRGNNRAIGEWGATHAWMTCLAYVACDAPVSPDALDALWERGFRGLSLYCLTAAAGRTVATWPARVTRSLNEHRAVVSINATPEALEALGDVFARLDGCACLISHLGLPGRYESVPTAAEARDRLRPLLAISSRTTVGVKLSGLYATAAYPHAAARPLLDQVLETFGPERLYWGSDFPPSLEHVTFAQTIDCLGSLGMPSATLPGVFGGNLSRVLSQTAACKL